MFNLDLDFLFNFNLGDSKVGPTRGVAVKSPCTVNTCMVILTYLIKNEFAPFGEEGESNKMNSENNSQSQIHNQNHKARPYNNPAFDEIDKQAADQARFIKLVEGQDLTLQFYPERTEIKEVDFQGDGKLTPRVNFIVTDLTGKFEGEKEISFGVPTAKRITAFLQKGINSIRNHKNWQWSKYKIRFHTSITIEY